MIFQKICQNCNLHKPQYGYKCGKFVGAYFGCDLGCEAGKRCRKNSFDKWKQKQKNKK